MSTSDPQRTATRAEWLEARKQLLAREKELTHLREEIAAERRALPWVAVENDYVFDTEKGRATLAELFAGRGQLLGFRERMGWSFPWVSSASNDFNRDFAVSFTPDELATKARVYNFGTQPFGVEEAPGISVFAKDAAGSVFRTYSCYSRGLDMLNPTYQLLDLVPKGRAETGLAYPMGWVRLHDEYESS